MMHLNHHYHVLGTVLTLAFLVQPLNGYTPTRSQGAAANAQSTRIGQEKADGARANRSRDIQNLSALPLYFVKNQGQTDSSVCFYLPGADKTIYFTPGGLTFALTAPVTPVISFVATPASDALSDQMSLPRPGVPRPPAPQQRWTIKLDFVGAAPNVKPVGEMGSDAVFSYFTGPASQWKTGLPTYRQIRYPNLWPGTDLVYSGQVNQMKYEFVVQPGADPARIHLAYRGASAVQLTADGQLAVTTPLGGFSDAAPVAYQLKAGQRVPVAMRYALEPDTSGRTDSRYEYGFQLGAYDPELPLVLDPAVLVYAGYIGGAGNDVGQGIAVDQAGNAYITGNTTSDQLTFP